MAPTLPLPALPGPSQAPGQPASHLPRLFLRTRQLLPVLPTMVPFPMSPPLSKPGLITVPACSETLLAPHYPQDQDRPQGPGSCPSCPSPPGPRAWHGVEATRGCSGRGLSSARPQPPARNALSSFPRLSRPSGGGPWRISGGRSCCLQPTLRAGMRSLLSDGRSLRPRTVHPSPQGPHQTKDWRRSAECPHQTGHHCISQRDRESLRSGQGECPPSEIRGCALSIRPGTLDSGLNLLHSLEALGGRAGSPH